MNTIFILPISGIDIVRYIAIYSKLSEINLKPNVIFSASGGCIASYVAMMSDFSSSVEHWKFTPDMFIKKTTPITPRLLTISLFGYLYHRPNITKFIREQFAFQKIQDVEIISGCFEANGTKISIESNFSESNSFLRNHEIMDVVNLINIKFTREKTELESRRTYLKDVMNSSCETIFKTSNIPLMMKPIGTEKAIDFGVISTSPKDFVRNLTGKIFYFSPIDITNWKKESLYTMYFNNLVVIDITKLKEKYEKEFKTDSVQVLKDFYDNHDEFCVIAYSKCEVNLSIDNFSEKEFSRVVQVCKENINFVIFYND